MDREKYGGKNMKTGKRIGLGVLLVAALLVISIGFVAASSAPAADSNISGNASPQEVKLPDNQRETVVTNVMNEPGIGELPMPKFREDVIIYFKEMPELGAFASKYRGRLIFVKPDIKMAAFETSPIGRPGKTSQQILDFINEVSKDPLVEKAYQDGFMFIKPEKVFSLEPKIAYPEDFDIKGLAYAPKEVKVGFWRLPSSLEEFASKYGAKLVYVEDVLLFAVFETDDSTEFIKKISTDPYVRHAEPNGIVHISSTPNDPKWNLQWGPKKIYAPEAWDYQNGSTNIVVAVIDTGVDYNHEDLAGHVYQGYDFANNDSDPMDDSTMSHGTKVAGISGAIMNNGKGIAGVAQSKILAVKVMDNNGDGTWSNISRGIRYAANNSANIISISITDYYNDPDAEAACNYAYYNKGSLLVAASGNQGVQQIAYPAAFDSVIAVGATDYNDQRAFFSNYGSDLELVAPGLNINSTIRNNLYENDSGTSLAVPHVSGVAALIWSQNPSFNNEKVREVLRNTAVDLGSAGRDIYYGYGKVNAYGAVTKGKLLTSRSGTITGSGGYSQYSVNIPAPSTVNVVMAGNENADFDLYAKWGSPPTTSSYDAKSDSSYSLEYFPIKGSGTLYIMVRSYSGSGNWKSWVVGGLYTDSGKKQGTLSGTGAEATYSLNGVGIGYAFNSGPDGSNFDLYNKWYSPPTTSSYDARGNSPGAQEIAGPAPFGNGTNYFMIHSTSGNGEYVTVGMIY